MLLPTHLSLRELRKMRIKRLVLALLIMTMLSPLFSTPAVTAFSSSGTNRVSYRNLKPGDIILLANPGSFFDYLIPGKFQHAEIFCGYVQSGEHIWDRTNKRWMPVGTPYVIHSTKSKSSGNGFGYDTWQVGVNDHADDALVLRVLHPDGSQLTSSERSALIRFLKSQLSGGVDGYPVGPAYDIKWFRKSVYSSDGGYYCSEAAWAAYYHVLNIDLDSDTSPFNIGVSPDDLLHSQYTSVIAGEIGSSRWQPYYGFPKVTVYLSRIYYYNDYDPLWKGAGEMYIKAFIGDSGYPTAEGYPGCGKIGRTPDGTWSRSGRGYLYWHKHFHSLINYYRPLKVRIEAWEHDIIDPDDSYPAFEVTFSYTSWHRLIGTGWHSYVSNKGDCIYYIYIRIDR